MGELLSAKLPDMHVVDLTTRAGGSLDLTIKYQFKVDGSIKNSVSVCGFYEKDVNKKDIVKLKPTTVSSYTDGTMTLDELCQSSEIRNIQANTMQSILNTIDEIDRSLCNETYLSSRIKADPYIAQSMVMEGKDISMELINLIETNGSVIPKEYFVTAPDNIVPDTEIVNAVIGYIGDGTPCTAMIGPTGSGKSFTAKYIAGILTASGFASMTVDANERTEGDRLFERDDFNSEGTFILEGTLLEFARRTKELGLRGLVVLEEYNAFGDSTRREFYRLFSNTDRYYQIESGNAKKMRAGQERDKRERNGNGKNDVQNRVDFSHIQFLITANPITSDRYLVDDLKRLSNAEARRVTMVYHDYATSRTVLTNIFKTIIKSKPITKLLMTKYPNFSKTVNISDGVKCFQELNAPSATGDRLGFDFGYTSIANWVWTAAVRGNTAPAWISSSLDHLLNPVPDHELRRDIAQKLDSKFGIRIGSDLIYRDA